MRQANHAALYSVRYAGVKLATLPGMAGEEFLHILERSRPNSCGLIIAFQLDDMLIQVWLDE